MQKARSGFTLVELAIVLVIIGLLIGGVLKGQAMIENAKSKRLKTDVDGLVAAVYGYQDKFGEFPGDNSVDHTSVGCTGDGDGVIENAAESVCAFRQLIEAGFISGDATLTVETQVSKRNPYGDIYRFRVHNNVTTIEVNDVPSDIGLSMDTKYDDKAYDSGDVQANADYTGVATVDLIWYAF